MKNSNSEYRRLSLSSFQFHFCVGDVSRVSYSLEFYAPQGSGSAVHCSLLFPRRYSGAGDTADGPTHLFLEIQV